VNIRIKNKMTGEIVEIDNHSAREARLRRRVQVWAGCLDQVQKYTIVEVCLTYIRGGDWQPGHIENFMKLMRKKYGENLYAYAWVAENQERGAIHYHVELIMPDGFKIELPDKAGDWFYGCTNVKRKRSVWYIITHCGKERQSYGLPGGARRFAVWISKDFATKSKAVLRVSAYPVWIRKLILEGDFQIENVKVTRAIGGGWLINGQLYKSEWELMKNIQKY